MVEVARVALASKPVVVRVLHAQTAEGSPTDTDVSVL